MSFDDEVLRVIAVIERGEFTTYGDVAEAAGEKSRNGTSRVGTLARKNAAKTSHRILRIEGKKFAVSREFALPEDGGKPRLFRYAIAKLEEEGIKVSEGGIVLTPENYRDATTLLARLS